MKHFHESEFARFDLLRPEMASMLDELRDRLGSPIIITSSYRDPVHNAAVGGAPDSSHTPAPDGLYSGIDFTIPGSLITPRALFWIVKHAYDVGFKRVGLYSDMRHVHLDCESRLDQEAIWIK